MKYLGLSKEYSSERYCGYYDELKASFGLDWFCDIEWSVVVRFLKISFSLVNILLFRSQCTQDQAKSLGLRGWCKNTPEGTVQGQVEGPAKDLQIM